MTQAPGDKPKLTKAQRKTLVWFSEREWADRFGVDGPSLTFVRKLCDLGWVERLPSSGFTLVKFRITPAGRSALSQEAPHDG